MKNKQEWAVLPYNSSRIDSKFLVSNLFGSWSLLERSEFINLEQNTISEGSPLFNRLYESGIIAKEDSFAKRINEYRKFQAHLFTDTSLHIAVVTTRCNLACTYCQTKTDHPEDMDFKVAAQVLKYLFDMRNPYVNLEFQGGEPLLNWKVVKFLIENAKQINVTNKILGLSLVTNGLLLDKKKIDFLIQNNVGICISLDGPDMIHDKNRVCRAGKGTYKKVRSSIQLLKKAYKDKGVTRPLDLLCTVTRTSLSSPEKLIDEYLSWGVERIALRPVNKIGLAKDQWERIGYSPEEFNRFWARAIDYLLRLNKKNIHMKERLASVMLTKIFKKENPGYVDMMSPCGAGRSVLVYMPNGDIYPCDEARMAGSDIFKLGNVLKDKYEQVMKSTNLFCLCEASLMELWDYHSAYLPWMGTCPVVNYILGDNLIPKITTTPLYKIYNFQLEYLFKKMAEDKAHEKIFLKWLD